MSRAPIVRTLIVRWWLLVFTFLVSASCGGGGSEVPAQVICLDCSGLGGNARLNCETQNANTKGC